MSKLKGVLKTVFNALAGGIDPEIGILDSGEIFVINVTLNAAGDPILIPEIAVISLVTTTTALSTSAATVVSASTAIKTLEFFNSDTSIIIFLAFEGVTATSDFWPLLPQAYYTPPQITQGAVSAIAASGTPNLLINVGT